MGVRWGLGTREGCKDDQETSGLDDWLDNGAAPGRGIVRVRTGFRHGGEEWVVCSGLHVFELPVATAGRQPTDTLMCD